MDWRLDMGIKRQVAAPASIGVRQDQQPDAANRGYFPNFCSADMAVKVILLAEFLAIVVTVLTRARYTQSMFAEFISVSLFLQWIALTSIATLCLLRPRLNAMSPPVAFGAAYVVLLLIGLAVTECSVWVLYFTDTLTTPRPQWYAHIHLQNLVVSVVVNALALRYLLAMHQLRRQTLNTAEYQSQVRRYRVRPHFIFNALNNIAGLMRRRPAAAETATEQLADLVRLMLDENQETVPLRTEIDNAEKFLALESLRLDERLRIRWQGDALPTGVRTPVQMLQLLLEYAIAHGVEPLSDGGEIGVKIGVVAEEAIVDIECTPTNCADDLKTESMFYDQKLDTTTLANIRLRLQDLYGMDGVLTTKTESKRLHIQVRHPAEGASL